jgi:hypothetical protein
MAPAQNRLSIMPPLSTAGAALLRRHCARVAALLGRLGDPAQGEPRTTPSLKKTR